MPWRGFRRSQTLSHHFDGLIEAFFAIAVSDRGDIRLVGADQRASLGSLDDPQHREDESTRQCQEQQRKQRRQSKHLRFE